ncbi:hypothetical protein EZS27_031519, partial [termite gut metagenome]
LTRNVIRAKGYSFVRIIMENKEVSPVQFNYR